MSGLAGIAEFFSEASLTCDSVHRMMDVMSYRGPDGRYSASVAGASFGHLALDASGHTGQQPLQQKGCLLVADLHLTDRGFLIEKLKDRLSSGSPSDSELVLQAYLRWGKSCPSHLTGSFAFVVYDHGTLFMARDHLGVKPIYYAETRDRKIVFASEAKPVAEILEAPLNRARIADALVFPLEHVDKVSTPYEGVYRLPPGCSLSVDQQGVSLHQFWDGGDIAPLALSDDEWVAHFRDTMRAVLKDHQMQNQPLAVALSGGVDSATVACMAAGSGIEVEAFSTVLPDDESCLDTKYISTAVGRSNLNANLVAPASVAESAERLLDQLANLQEPFDAHMIQLMLLNQAAAQAGHKALLDGVDGELIYSMPGSYPTLLYREGRLWEGLREAIQASRCSDQWPLASLYSSLRGLGAPGFLKALKRSLSRKQTTAIYSDTWIALEFAEEIDVVTRIREMRARIYGGPADMFETHRRTVTHPAIGAALERYDRVAALSGIESRHPLLDIRLVELMLAAPDHLKVRHGWSKYLLRLAGAPDVPVEISWRTDKQENAWRFSEELARLKEADLRQYLVRNWPMLKTYLKPEALDAGASYLPELFGFSHWLVGQQRD